MLSRLRKRVMWSLMSAPGIRESQERRRIQDWLQSGKVGPAPHLVKQANLRRIQSQFHTSVLVETGTFRADMMVAMSPYFEQLYSVELSESLCTFSRGRCSHLKNVDIRQGASEDVLAEICGTLNGQVLFWLDGHFSGGDTALGTTECPVVSELRTILAHPQITPVIVIDDAREFNGTRSYPTIREIVQILNAGGARLHVTVADDAIVIVPECLYQ